MFAPKTKSKHILIVDDEPKVAFFLRGALERSGGDFHVSTARSGEEALEVLESSEVDLLVTDLRMPGLSGLELIRWVRGTSPQTRTILITAYGDDEVEAEARRLEAYRYITKPFDIGDFTQAVQGALRGAAISQPGFTILADDAFEEIAQELESLRYDIGARCIFLGDMQGQRLAEVGDTQGFDATTLLALLAGGFATSGELARRFGDGEAINLNYHEGDRYEIYSANVGDNLFLAIIYDRRVKSSRVGIVWLYTRRAIESLLSTVSTSKASGTVQSLDEDFGNSLRAELDTLFTEESFEETLEPPSVPDHAPQREVIPEKPSQPKKPSTDRQDQIAAPTDSSLEPEAGREEATPGVSESNGDSTGELFNLEEAIARGLIPDEFGQQSEGSD